MPKLRLDLDALAVETFAAQAEDRTVRGTVDARELVASNVYSCWNTCRCPSHHNTECCGAI
ncbi:MAG TPA: hypothetical protein VHG08_21080 [Longimicrobium sp.]|nr:hypothetical protein [Longimicrobium sp.]